MIAFQCPRCRARLKEGDEEYICSCGACYPVIDGIPVFVQDTNYYGEIPKEKKEELLASMDRGVHWRELVWENFGTSYPFLHHIIVDETRNDFRYFLPVNRDSVILDLGAGWGTMSCHFAADCREVIALDGTLDRCRFIKMRCDQDGVMNVRPVCANILDNPFPPKSFDVIIMNGVLEWVGASREDRPPRDQQLEVLRITGGMLKEGGVLYIGIENSHGYKYILGEMDDHTGIHHISYLDRKKADEKSLKELGRPYRTYTYDLAGYTELLNAAGFAHARFLYPIPDYKSVEFLLQADHSDLLLYYHKTLTPPAPADSLKERIRSLETRAAQLGHVEHHAAGYGIVVGRPSVSSKAEKIHSLIIDNWEAFFHSPPSRLRTLQISGTPGKVFEKGRIKHLLFADGDVEPCLLAVFCRSRRYEESLRREHEFCKAFRNDSRSGFLVPEGTFVPELDGGRVLIQRAFRGKSLSWHLADACLAPAGDEKALKSKVDSHFRLALASLRSLHRPDLRIPGADSRDRVLERIRRVLEALGESTAKRFTRAVKETLTLYEGQPNVPIHGDFTPWNILLSDAGVDSSRPALIDWELGGFHPLTILDYARFAYYYITDLERFGALGCDRRDGIRRIFVSGDHWLSGVVSNFLGLGLAELGQDPLPLSSLMQFMLLHDAALQMEYSAKPLSAFLPNYLGLISALEKEE